MSVVQEEPHMVLETADHLATGQQCVRVRSDFDAGAIVATFVVASSHDTAGRMTMQVSEAMHVVFEPAALRLANHACDPNALFDVVAHVVVALRAIAAGEELTCFYPATEWEMAEPFECACGSARCVGKVAGAAHMPDTILSRYALAPHIRRLLASAGRLESQRQVIKT